MSLQLGLCHISTQVVLLALTESTIPQASRTVVVVQHCCTWGTLLAGLAVRMYSTDAAVASSEDFVCIVRSVRSVAVPQLRSLGVWVVVEEVRRYVGVGMDLMAAL